MKIVCISDTHNQHSFINNDILKNEDGAIDTIIHAGDISLRGTRNEISPFLNWYNKLPFKNKILIAGNHDFFFETGDKDVLKQMLSYHKGITYLNDSGVEIDGIKFWGSPVQPWFYNWAFNRVEEAIKPHWDMIPSDTNVLITHGPIKGYLDRTIRGDSTGCPHLRDRILDLTNLKLHVCGHIHEGYGKYDAFGCQLVNASVLDHNYKMSNAPILVEINI